MTKYHKVIFHGTKLQDKHTGRLKWTTSRSRARAYQLVAATKTDVRSSSILELLSWQFQRILLKKLITLSVKLKNNFVFISSQVLSSLRTENGSSLAVIWILCRTLTLH